MKVPCLRVLKRWETVHMTNHIYQNHLEQVRELLAREPFALPKLEIIGTDSRLRGLEGLLAMRYDNLELVGYKCHKKIPAGVAV